jgi:hypothetical protein
VFSVVSVWNRQKGTEEVCCAGKTQEKNQKKKEMMGGARGGEFEKICKAGYGEWMETKRASSEKSGQSCYEHFETHAYAQLSWFSD